MNEQTGPLIASFFTCALLALIAIAYVVRRGNGIQAGAPRSSKLARISLLFGLLSVFVLPSLIAIPLGHVALYRIRKSGGRLIGARKIYFALILAYGALASLAAGVISSATFRQKPEAMIQAQIVTNLFAIDEAKSKWAAATKHKANAQPSADDISAFMPDRVFPPISIFGESYQIKGLNEQAEAILPRPIGPLFQKRQVLVARPEPY